MFITKESDYAIRIVRALAHGDKMNVKSICAMEHVPRQYAYKILKKLENGGLVKSYRGTYGGYALNKSPDKITLYDIIFSIETNLNISGCTEEGTTCIHNTGDRLCKVHLELCKLQDELFKRLKEKSMSEILSD